WGRNWGSGFDPSGATGHECTRSETTDLTCGSRNILFVALLVRWEVHMFKTLRGIPFVRLKRSRVFDCGCEKLGGIGQTPLSRHVGCIAVFSGVLQEWKA